MIFCHKIPKTPNKWLFKQACEWLIRQHYKRGSIFDGNENVFRRILSMMHPLNKSWLMALLYMISCFSILIGGSAFFIFLGFGSKPNEWFHLYPYFYNNICLHSSLNCLAWHYHALISKTPAICCSVWCCAVHEHIFLSIWPIIW